MDFLSVDEQYAEQIELFCEENSIDFSIVNVEEVLNGTSDKVKYEIDGENVSKVQDYYNMFTNN